MVRSRFLPPPLRAALFCALAAAAMPAPAEDLNTQLVDTLTKLAGGPHAGYRANHAKGQMLTGTFTPAASAKTLSKASYLNGGPVKLLARFSDGTGVPTIPDADPHAKPNGLALRFQLDGGAFADMVCISTNGFPASTPENFLAFLQAVAASGPDAAKPTPIEKFLAEHPESVRFVQLPKPAPVGFGTQTYYGVNAFKFTNAEGKEQYGRYRITPLGGEKFLSEAEAKAATPDYLYEGLQKQLPATPVEFRITVQLAAAGDKLDDGTAVWPDDRPQVELGTVRLDALVADSKAEEKKLMFSPLNLVDGIAPSADPVLLARPGAYAVSFGRRVGK